MNLDQTAASGAAATNGAPILLSPGQIARSRSCDLSLKTVYRAIAAGELRASRLSNRLRVRPADLDAWIDACRLEAHDRAEWGGQAPTRVTYAASDGLRALLTRRIRDEQA